MSSLFNMQRDVERQMSILADLPAPTASAASLQRVRQAVMSEAARQQRFGSWLRFMRPWVGVAAALLLAAGWTLRPESPGVVQDGAVALAVDGATIDDWAEALVASDAHVAAAFDEIWLPLESGDADAGLDDALDAFDSSLEALRVGA